MAQPPAPLRHRLEIDPNDNDEVRRYMAEKVAGQIMTRCQPIPAIHLLLEEHEEVLELSPLQQADPGFDVGATWRALAARPDVERRLLVLRFEHENGLVEACIFEEYWEDGAPVAWWFGHRPYRVQDGIGHLMDEGWQQHEGQGPAPEPFESLLRPAPGGRPARLGPARKPEGQMWMGDGEFPEAAPLPQTAMQMTELMQAVVLDAMAKEGFRHLTVFLLRGRAWERWLLGEHLPTAGDDIVRWICGRVEPQPDAVATAEGVLMELDGQPQRTIRIAAELGGQRAERVIVLVPKPDEPDQAVPGRWMARDLGALAEGEGWIGVEPLVSGEITAKVLGYGPLGGS